MNALELIDGDINETINRVSVKMGLPPSVINKLFLEHFNKK
jgi:hypothetical protein